MRRRNDLRLAMPASPAYLRRKKIGVREGCRTPRVILGRAMTQLADEAARVRALTDLAATLLVEAAAGTGKTSLLAGRVLCLLASGVPPARNRSDHLHRICRRRVAGAHRAISRRRCCPAACPDELRLAFPERPDREQTQALQEAAQASR